MPRKAQTDISFSKEFMEIFADIYEGYNDDEKKVIDCLLQQWVKWFWVQNHGTDEMPERTVAKITGLSKSGARVVTQKAMDNLKAKLVKSGIKRAADVFGSDEKREYAKASSSHLTHS